MKKNQMLAAVSLFASLMLPGQVLAQPVQITGDPVPLQVKSQPAGETEGAQEGQEGAESPSSEGDTTIKLLQFDVLGLTDNDTVALKVDDSYVLVDRTDFQLQLPVIDLNSLPNATGWTDLTQGSSGAAVSTLQQNLISLGNLTGGADGAFGPGTAAGVSAFQTENGLAATGVADVYTQMAVQGAVDGTWKEVLQGTYPVVYSPEEKFASIIDQVDQDLDPFLDPAWRFNYDRMAEDGTLDLGVSAGGYTQESPAIDRISLTASFKVLIRSLSGDGLLTLIPALVVDSTGAYRPYVTSAVFSSSDGLSKISGAVSSGKLDGITIAENSYIPLTADAIELLQESGNVNVVIEGANNTYEFALDVDQDQLSAFLDAVKDYTI